MDSLSSTYSAGHAVVGGWEFTATSSTGNLQRTLHALNSEEHQTAGIPAPCCETVESIIRAPCHVFWGTFVKCGGVMLNRNALLRMWLRRKKFLPACVSDEAAKPCFISALGKIFALISSKQARFFTPRQPDRDAAIPDPVYYGFKSTHTPTPRRDTDIHTHTHTPILLPSKAF